MKYLAAIACAVAFSLSAQAQLPKTLSFQGYLTNSAGEPITTATDAPLDVTFSLYTAKTGGTLVWGPEAHELKVEKGIFNTILGASTVTAVPLDFGGSLTFAGKYFLEIIVNPGTASTETLSRIELTSSMYSLSTLNATNITSGTLSGALLDEVAASKVTGSLAVANGGTGATTAADARTNLGVQASDTDLDDLADGTLSGAKIGTGIDAANITTNSLAIANGGTGATTAADARTNLGVQATDTDLDDLADGSLTGSKIGPGIVADSITSGTLSSLRLDSDLQDLADGELSGSKVGSGIDAANITTNSLAIVNGGTGAATEADARTNLGLEIGADVQAWDQALNDISGLIITDGNIIVGNGTNWIAESGSTARASLGLAIGTDVQAYDAGLNSIAGLTVPAGQILYTTAEETFSSTQITAFGAALIDDANAFTARSTLGLVIGTNVQAYDDDLADLADGTLSDNLLESTVDVDSLSTLNGASIGGSVAVGGYTQLGSSDVSVDSSNPSGATVSYSPIKVMIVEGTTATASSTATVTLIGTNSINIISIQLLVEYSADDFVPPRFTASPNLEYTFNFEGGILYIRNASGNSSSIASKPFKAVITYTE